MDNGVTTLAMLVSLNISAWTARVLDKKVSADVASDKGATLDAGRYNKLLVPAEALARITKATGAARQTVYHLTLPWDDSGRRLLPVKSYEQFLMEVQKVKAEFEEAVEEFLENYPTLREQRRFQLNTMFNEGDYPSVEALRRKFQFDVGFDVISDPSDIRVALPEHRYRSLVSSIESNIASRQQAATAALWQRLHECVANIADKCSTDKGRVYDSAFDNLTELLGVVDNLNVTNDPTLSELAEKTRTYFGGLKAADVRKDKEVRQMAAYQASELARQMADYI